MDFRELLSTVLSREGTLNSTLNEITRIRAFGRAGVETIEALLRIREKGLENKLKAGMEFWEKSYQLNIQALSTGLSINEVGSTSKPIESGTVSQTYDGTDLEDGIRINIQTLLAGTKTLHLPSKVLEMELTGHIVRDGYISVVEKYGGRHATERVFREIERDIDRIR